MNGTMFHAFTYDPNGNRLSFTSPDGTVNYTYDDQDRLLSAGSTSYTYGSNGELKTKTVAGVGTTTYTYDAFGNLMTVVLPDGTRIDHVIDAQNRRVGRKVNGVLLQGWLYQDQLHPVVELDGSGNVVSRFVYGSRANVPDYLIKNGVGYRLVTDHLGSVRLVVDTATGVVVQRLDYDEWGYVSENTNPGFQPFGFAGGLYDAQTALVRFGARDYDATAGRWTAKDPIGFATGTSNLYAYANHDPVNAGDPTGLVTCPKDPWAACKAAALRLAATAAFHKLGASILNALGNIGRSGVLLQASARGDATSSLLADFNEIAAAAHRSMVAEGMEDLGTQLATKGVPQLGVAVGWKAYEVAEVLESDRPWWWKFLAPWPIIGTGLQLGEAFDACGTALGQWLIEQ